MTESPPTRSSLLVRLRNHEDQPAWNEFVDIYAPLIHSYGVHRGLQDADAADLAQDVLQSVWGACDRFEYDPQRGSFRGWLFTVTRNKLLNLVDRKERRGKQAQGTVAQDLMKQQPADDHLEEAWIEQHRARLFDWACEEVREEFTPPTWKAFWKTAVDDVAASRVAQELGISIGAVYIAKSRVLTRLREKIQSIEETS